MSGERHNGIFVYSHIVKIYSDCGDVEAWKKDFYCEDHTPTQKSDNDGIITDEMKEICSVVFQGILAYCVNTLQIDSDTSYPDLESDTNPVEDLFCTLLYNDETHTFDQVSAFEELIR